MAASRDKLAELSASHQAKPPAVRLGEEADQLANDLARGHYSMAEAISMLRRCSVMLRKDVVS